MITSKDLRKKLEDNQTILDNQVDQWLEHKVLPFFTKNELTLPSPEHIEVEVLINTLKQRGIISSVDSKIEDGILYKFITVSLPPQGK